MSTESKSQRTEILAAIGQNIRQFKRMSRLYDSDKNYSAKVMADEAVKILECADAYIKSMGVQPGDYVLATKYQDGDPRDHWVVGFYTGLTGLHYNPPRFDVVNDQGEPFRNNGFRCIAGISKERGQWLLDHSKEIAASGKSVWEFVDCPMDAATDSTPPQTEGTPT